MRLINCSKYLTGAQSLKEIYTNLILVEIEKSKSDKSLSFSQFLSQYSEKELLDAIADLRYNRGFIEAPEHTRSLIILKLLEYGGPKVKPTHILSKAKLNMNNYFNMMEGRND